MRALIKAKPTALDASAIVQGTKDYISRVPSCRHITVSVVSNRIGNEDRNPFGFGRDNSTEISRALPFLILPPLPKNEKNYFSFRKDCIDIFY